MNELDRAKRSLVQAFEEGSATDLSRVLEAFPDHREELLDFWVILSTSDREVDAAADVARSAELSESEQATIRDICLSASLGVEWLDKPAAEGDRILAEVGLEMRRVRSSPYRYDGPANEHFQRAAIYAWLADQWAGSRNDTTSRMAVQKLAYLLDKGLGVGVFGKHKTHGFGPYDPTARYRDAEPIALKNGYLVKAGQWEFGFGPEIEKGAEMAQRYLRDAAVARTLVGALRSLGLDEWALETMATVHAIAVKMPPGAVSTEAVQSALAKHKTWKRKLGRSNFTHTKIEQALHRLSLLRLLETE